MIQETRQCQNCKQSFTVEPEDVVFYEKMNVPPPTWCPQCRQQRRMTWRNEQALFSRTCDKTKKPVVSIYPPGTRFPVWQVDTWFDKNVWDAREHGRDYDFSRPFFDQFYDLQCVVPRPHNGSLAGSRSVNSDYTNCSGDNKNCYMGSGTGFSEECYYTTYTEYSYRCMDVLLCHKCQMCYECVDIEESYNLQWCQSCSNCTDSTFLYDCRDCSDCIGCVGLRHKQYYIFNQPHSKEEYEKKKGELINGNRESIELVRKEWQEKVLAKFPRKYYNGEKNENFSGSSIARCVDSFFMFDAKNTKDCKYCAWMINGKDTHDYLAWGDVELCYEVVSCGYNSTNLRFCNACYLANYNLTYCDLCNNSNDLFGCVGLNGQRFCILNKQYTESEYHALVPKIIDHMTQTGEWGEMPPVRCAPCGYNDTLAYDYYPLTKEEVEQKGWHWTEVPRGTYGKETLASEKIPQSISITDESICNEVLACIECKKNYKIIKQEFALYKTIVVPVPLKCPECRHKARFALRTPYTLWERQCMCEQSTHDHGTVRCSRNFQTAYAPERPEIIYCEECYQNEIV